MLFYPFQILSVEKTDEAVLSAMPKSYCGILCCGDGSGTITVGERELRFHQGLCLFMCEAGNISLRREKSPCSMYWIGLKINHVDLLTALRQKVLKLRCSPLSMEKLCRSTESACTLYQLTELLLLEYMEMPETPSKSFMSQDAHSPELMDIYAALTGFLDANLQNDFTAPQLAAAVGCSHRQLNNILQKHSGCTTLEFVNEYRIQKARLYLISSQQTITQIAALTGFKSVHYFSRVFKKHTGESPQSFRASFLDRNIP